MIMIDGVQIIANGTENGSASNVSSRLSDIDLSNAERVEVVQGAAAATIYGAQGANGVIQIFTKKGKRDGKLRINLRNSVSFDQVLRGNLTLAKNHFYDTDAQGFIVNNAKVTASGGSDVNIYVNKALEASASGGSDINYKGNAALRKTSSSKSGDVNHVN